MSERTPDGTAYEFSGSTDAPVVILIHGLGLCRRMWDGLVPTLAQRYRVLAYDLYGHGDSVPLPTNASLGSYADQIANLMKALGIETAAIIGFSIGGMINRRFALDHVAHASSLVILNSPHDRGRAGQELVEKRAIRAREEGPMATLGAALERWFTPEFRAARPDAIHEVRNWRGGVDPKSYTRAASILARGVPELIAPDPPIACPVLVMTCENDSGSTPAMSVAISHECSDARLVVVPDLRHLGLMERPDVFVVEILDFLRHSTE